MSKLKSWLVKIIGFFSLLLIDCITGSKSVVAFKNSDIDELKGIINDKISLLSGSIFG